MKANAGCKHFDVHGGPENIPVSRFDFDAKVIQVYAMKIQYYGYKRGCIIDVLSVIALGVCARLEDDVPASVQSLCRCWSMEPHVQLQQVVNPLLSIEDAYNTK